MIKKSKTKRVKQAKAKKGNKYVCSECGVVVSVDNPCSCSSCDLTCCGEAMKLMAC